MNAQTGYEAPAAGAAFYVHRDCGALLLEGTDRHDFLQRQSTNDIRNLRKDSVLTTVLTSPTARIIDVLILLEDADALQILTLPGRAAATAQFLRSRIFFMDKVVLRDRSSDVCQIDVMGARYVELLNRVGISVPALGEVGHEEAGGIHLIVIRPGAFIGHGSRLLVSASLQEQAIELLLGAEIEQLSRAAYEVLRVEAGVPGPSGELAEEYSPLEVGLEYAVSDSKGCYTGQEVIARQITYDKVTRHLVGLALSAPVQVGAAVQSDGRTIGAVTSYAHSPRFGDIALAVLKRPHDEPGAQVAILADGGTVTGSVRTLPFADDAA